MATKRWVIAPPIPATDLAPLGSLPPLLAQILYQRGLRTQAEVEEFLHPPEGLANPFLLKGMAEAVSRLRVAIRKQEPIAVYGDYDVDGVTATALLVQVLQALGAQVRPYIPHRVEEGYGLNMTAMQKLTELGVRLVVTVDCGVRSLQEVEYAREHGIEVIITDHHGVGPTLPAARAIINPKQSGERYPGAELAGVGLAFKLAQALLRAENQVASRAAGDRTLPTERELLDLVALGTVADVVPLTGENRLLVWHGLRELNASRRPGLCAMFQEAGVTAGRVSAYTIGYVLGPRLNATGRMDSALQSYKLIVADTPEEAATLASELGLRNRQRQQLTAELAQKAREQVLQEGVGPILIIAGSEYVAGVAGLVASRLADEFYRPAIVVERGESESKGSCRSIPEFHITEALDGCAKLLVRHGGHAAAAGFTIRNEPWEAFTTQLRQIAQQRLEDIELTPKLMIDAELPLSDINWATAGLLEQLEPFGQGNPTPLFLSRNVSVRDHRVAGGKHLQLTLSDGRVALDAIAFGMGPRAAGLAPQLDVVYTLAVDEWNGQRRLKLFVRDFRAAEG